MADLLVITVSRHARSWPKHDDGEPAPYGPLSGVLTGNFEDDRHTAAYAVPSIERRLATDAFQALPDGVPMVLGIFDMDAPGKAPTEEWWRAENDKLERLLADHPGAIVYSTNGGYRILYQLPVPVVLRSVDDA